MGIRKPRSRADAAEVNGRRLLDAARRVFVQKGYASATLDQVARAAGLTKGAVYARFDGKADLFLALLAERIDFRLRELRALPAPPSSVAAGDAVFRQWLERSRDADWSLLVLEFRVAAARDPQLNARYAALHERVIAAIAERIELGARAAGTRLSQPASAIARIGFALSSGVVLERAVADQTLLPDALTLAANRDLLGAFELAPQRREPVARSRRGSGP